MVTAFFTEELCICGSSTKLKVLGFPCDTAVASWTDSSIVKAPRSNPTSYRFEPGCC